MTSGDSGGRFGHFKIAFGMIYLELSYQTLSLQTKDHNTVQIICISKLNYVWFQLIQM